MNTVFEPIPPMKPIVMPGVGESSGGDGDGAERGADGRRDRCARRAFAHVAAQATVRVGGAADRARRQPGQHGRRSAPRVRPSRRRTARSRPASSRTSRSRARRWPCPDGDAGGVDGRPASAAGRSDGDAADAAAEPAAAAGDVRSSARWAALRFRQRRADRSDRGQPAVEPSAGRRLGCRRRARAWSGRRRCPARAGRWHARR